MHFAAFTYVGESVAHPLMYYRNNVGGTAALLQAVINFKTLPVVFSSTAAVYGMPETVPIPEDHPRNPINPYGFSKLAAERMLLDLGASHQLPFIALRYFNAAGADPDGRIGEMHNPETHIIPLVLLAARQGTAVKIFGTDYDTPDGTCIRDYIHVVDIADAHVRALDHLLKGGESSPLNLANAQGYSVREVITAAERVVGHPIRVELAPRRPGDPASLIGNSKRAREMLGWTPSRSALDIQIADAWNWLKGAESARWHGPARTRTH
jgi:UDP-glucose-4-epimerase GalE